MSVNGVHNIISDDRAVEPFHKKNYCRLCLREKEKLIPIFESGDEISKFIEKVFFIKIRVEDRLSKKICTICMDECMNILQRKLIYKYNNCRLRRSEFFIKTEIEDEDDDVSVEFISSQPDECHKSIKKIFNDNEKILIPKTIWSTNIDVTVDVNKKPKPWRLLKNYEYRKLYKYCRVVNVDHDRPSVSDRFVPFEQKEEIDDETDEEIDLDTDDENNAEKNTPMCTEKEWDAFCSSHAMEKAPKRFEAPVETPKNNPVFNPMPPFEWLLKEMTSKQAYICRYCDKVFTNEVNWKIHEMAHTQIFD